jgi:hypothetical protein
MILHDDIANTTIPAIIVEGILLIADHPLPPEDAEELVIIEATDQEIAALEQAGYRWRRAPD